MIGLRDEALSKIEEGKHKFLSNSNIDMKRLGFDIFKQGLELLLKYAKQEHNQELRKLTTVNIRDFLQDAVNMDATLKNYTNSKGGMYQWLATTQLQKERTAFVEEKPNVKWDDVCGMDSVKKTLHEAITLPIYFPELFVGARTPWSGILLYGPPGTGKTFIAKASASLCNARFFAIQASDLMSRWVGESEKLVRQLFEEARSCERAIIFIDEIDSLLTSREGKGAADSSSRIKTEFLVQMQGLATKNTQLLVIGATNLPWMLDPAVRRRFEKRIYVPLPAIEARSDMFNKGLQRNSHTLTANEITELATITENYSSADISTIIREAAYEPLRHCLRATHFRVSQNKSVPCSPSDPQATFLTISQIDPLTLELPEIDYVIPFYNEQQDFMTALLNTKPSVDQGELQKYIEWTKEFGSS